jgi:hypothetical protein
MRKLFVMMFAVCVMLSVCSVSYAGSLILWGQVKSGGYPVAGATVVIRDPDFGFIAEVQTNSGGYWQYGYHNYDFYKIVSVSAPGKRTVSKNVTDNICCDSANPPAYCIDCGTIPPSLCGCATAKVVNFTLYTGTSDIDQDGVYDLDDNCSVTPNGPRAGTCVSGSEKGTRCYNQLECGCAAKPFPCRMAQTDGDDDGFGDVCDDDFMGAMTQETMILAHEFMTKESMSAQDILMAYIVYVTTHIKTRWQTFGDFLFAMQHLPSFWHVCGYPVIDQNENGIADGEEGLLPTDWTPADYVDAFQKAFQRCWVNE